MNVLRKLENEETSFYIQSKWSSSSFQITIIQGPDAWHANITEERIKELADERQKNKDEYYKDVKDSISNNKPNTTYDIKTNGSTCQFYIYRKIGNSKINYFISSLDKVDYQICVFNLIDDLNSKNLELVELLQKSEQDVQVAHNEKEICERKLQEFVELKANWEKELYSNFLLLLNEKKKRISFLTGLLQARKINADDVESEVEAEEKVSDVESEEVIEEYDTDNDDGDEVDKKPELEVAETQLSTSSAFNNLLKPDSPPPLLLPKRMKRDNAKIQTAPVAVATQQVPVAKIEKKEEKRKTPKEPKIAEENSPVLTFTTQDLLDRM